MCQLTYILVCYKQCSQLAGNIMYAPIMPADIYPSLLQVVQPIGWEYYVCSNHVSRTGFPTRLKCNKVRINKEKMSRMIVREKLSKRAVVKEDGLGRVYLQDRRLTPIRT